MGMPVILEIVDDNATDQDANDIFDFLVDVDNRFSTYKQTSEITAINDGRINESHYSKEMRQIIDLAYQTTKQSNGFFHIGRIGGCDPSGIVKGWAIHEASKLLTKKGFNNYYLEIAGDIQVSGNDSYGRPWKIGIRSPFNNGEIIKVINLSDKGVATSGSYERGNHIYNPKSGAVADAISSTTVIGPNIYEADRFATAAFAMGESGIMFIEQRPELEGYMINKMGIATMTSNFKRYVAHA